MSGSRESGPANLKEAMKFVVSDREKKVTVGTVLDLEKIMIELEELGVSGSLNRVLSRVEDVIYGGDFQDEFKKDPDLQDIIISSLEKSLEELAKLAKKLKAVSRIGGVYPDVLKIKEKDFAKKLNSPEDILNSVQTIMNLIGNYIAEIEPLLSKEQKKILGLNSSEESENVADIPEDLLNFQTKYLEIEAVFTGDATGLDPRAMVPGFIPPTSYLQFLQTNIEELEEVYDYKSIQTTTLRKERIELIKRFIIPAKALLEKMQVYVDNLSTEEAYQQAFADSEDLTNLKDLLSQALPRKNSWSNLETRRSELSDLLVKSRKFVGSRKNSALLARIDAELFDQAEKVIRQLELMLDEKPRAKDFKDKGTKENLREIESFFNLNRVSIGDGLSLPTERGEADPTNILVVDALRLAEKFARELTAKGGTKLTDKEKEKLEKLLFYLSKSAKRVQSISSDVMEKEVKGITIGYRNKPADLDDDEYKAYLKEMSLVKDPDSTDYEKANELLSLLHLEIRKQVDSLGKFTSDRYLKSLGLVEKKKDPYEMDIEEVIDEIAEAIVPTDRLRDLNARYFELIGSVEDKQLESWYRVRRGLQAVMTAGDTGVKGFDIGFDSIMVELADKGVDFNNIARALFLKRPEKKGPLTAEDMDKAEINMRAIEVYEYIVQRIKGKPEWGGVNYDPENPSDPLGRKDYSYNNLLNDRLSDFIKHLKQKFADIDPKLLGELIKYSQAMAAKSAGYVPWLMHATTRAHGLALTGLRKQEFSDELFVAAPFAAGQYSRNRYGDNLPKANSEELLYIHEKDLAGMVEYDSSGHPKHNKMHSIKELWHIIDKYRQAVWDNIPKWVKDTRDLMGFSTARDPLPETRLDLNSNFFPLPGEVTINILKMEQRKRDLMGMDDGPAKDRAIAAFTEEANLLGYGKNLNDIGIPQLTRLTVDQYMTVSFKALEKFNKAFMQEQKEISFDEVEHKFIEWLDKIIGKAKLVPGRHHLLFGPFTVRMMHRLSHMYSNATNVDEVDMLRHIMLKQLDAAGGVPQATKDFVHKYMDGYHVKEMVEYQYDLKVLNYLRALWQYKVEFKFGLKNFLGKLLPFNWSKELPNGEPLLFEAPWESEAVSEDTRA